MKLKKLLLSAMGFASMLSYSQFNYGEALQKSLFFYEAQQSGKLPDWNRVSWRADSATNDGSDVGKDLTGGWYDAGDHVKFGFPMAYSVTALAWGAIEYPEAYQNSGQMEILKNNLRYVTDYFIKCHTAPNEFYGQLGGGGIDHAFWGASEVMTMERPAYKVDASNPGSELTAETAAAMAAVSMLFADDDPAYSATLLQHAEELYSFADNYRGKYSDAITDAAGFYNSWSGYQDEIVWGAAWLYRATGDDSYLDKAKSEYANLGTEIGSDVKAYKWGLAWDDKSYGCYVLMSLITGIDEYKVDAERHLDYWTDGYNGERIAYSPGGQAHLTTWGSLRHSANTSLLAFIYGDKVETTKTNTYHDFAVRQINYALGDNPLNRSFMVGFGNDPANSVHHRGAHGPWANSLQDDPVASSHILYGALAGGPSAANDQFDDDRGDYIANEVATDYNAAFTGALARMYYEYGGTPLTNFPVVETPSRAELRSYSKFNSNNAYGSTISIMFQNRSAWPARLTDNISIRYFFDASELVEAGGSVDDMSITLSYSQTNNSSLSINVWDKETNIYYADISLAGNEISPVGDPAFRYEVQLQINTNNNPYDSSNDWSAIGLTDSAAETANIPVYDNGVLVFGNEPNGGETPVASFTSSTVSGLAPLEVEFNAGASSDPNGDDLTYSWDFGNGEISSLVNPTVIFDEVGSYLVSLTVSDGVNISTTSTETISVEDGNVAPVAIFEATPESGIAPVTVSFDASGSSDANDDNLTYSWDFGDGTTGTGVTTTHEYTNVDEYTVVLTVSDGSKMGTETQSITVTDGSPVAAISVSETSGVAPFEVTFSANDSVDPTSEGLTYAWDFGNGDTATTANATVTYTDLGMFSVSLTVTNAAGDTNSEEISITVTDGSQSCAFDTPIASALPGINTEYRNIFVLGEGGPNLDNVTIFTINWDTNSNTLHQFSMNTDNGSPSWWNDLKGNSHNFNSAQPEITFSGSDFAGLDGSYYATIDEDNFVLVSKTGGFTIYFSKSDQAPDCGDVIIIDEPNVAPVAALTGTPNSGTDPLTVTFDASGSTDADGDTLSYSIDYGDGTSGTGVTSTHIYNAGNYTATVMVTDGNGGSDTASVNISVDEDVVIIDEPNVAPVAALTGTPNSGTAPLTVTFDASGSIDADGDTLSYSIDYGDGTSGTGATSTHIYSAGNYTATVMVTDGNGGSDTASVNISVDEDAIVVTPPKGDCTFDTPTSTALTSVNTSYDNVHVLGSGGPNLDSITKFTINWDVQNNGLYQFSFNLNASPWYGDFSNTAQNFNEPSPSITLTGTGISGLDGTYDATVDNGNLVLVADNYTIYFSNSATAPDCEEGTTETNEAPIAKASASATIGLAPLDVTFDGLGSTDPDGDTLTYVWSFSDDTSVTGITVNKIFEQEGDYTATLTVTDPDGLNDTDSVIISVSGEDVNEAPTAVINVNNSSGIAPLSVSFNGSGSSDPEGEVLTYAWNFGDGTTATGVTANKTFDIVGSYDVILTVTDVEGLTANDLITITATEEDDGNGNGGGGVASSDNEYIDRFNEMRNEIYNEENGYFSADGSPHHSIETLIVEAPDYGHESTSELYSYWIWMEAMHGRISGDWEPLSEVWDTTEEFIIPTNADQPTNAAYDPSSPAAYAPEFSEPTFYPSPLNFSAPVGVDPVSSDLTAAYGSDIYQMHWLLDNDNFYGYGNRGDGVSTPSYINTFQRGEQESVFETIPHPSWEGFDWGGENGFLPFFVEDSNYSEQWRYTSAPDADARAVQAMYWALQYTTEADQNSSVLDLDKATKMGDYLRLAMFDKYFKPMGVQSDTSGAGTGYDSAHYLMSWYMSWGGSADPASAWAFRISSSHCHFGYQNPVAAYALTQVDELEPQSTNGLRDWNTSLERQMEFYTWLQSAEGGIAGGATNSWNGDYSTYPGGTSTFYGMAYDDNPVYHDPGSGTWFGWQAWSMERVAEYYYITNDSTAKNLMDKWTTWVESEVQLVGDNDFLMPATLEWSGQPDTWNASSPGSNSGLSVSVTNYNVDLGIAASTAKALTYYAAATEKYATLDEGAKTLAKEILDRMWTTYRDDKGCSSPESRGDYSRIFEEEVYVPANYSGVMGQGEAVEQGVSFLDIRSGYLNDPEYPALLEAYENGTDYTTRYHRTWAQMEIALANAEYGFFFDDAREKLDEAPTAVISYTKTSGDGFVEVAFDGSESTDPDGQTLTYAWSFENNETSAEVSPVINYDSIGTYTVSLTVTNEEGLTDTETVAVVINLLDLGAGGSSDNEYIDRFNEMRNEIYNEENGYFSADGSPHHSIETLIVEAPDYGHESTSELYSYWMWMEAMYGRISGDWEPLKEVWEKTEQFIIPTNADQPTNAAYSPSSPAAYAPEFGLPSSYPAPLDFSAPVGVDPVSADLTATYGPDIYQMHWLLDNDNFYGYGNRGDGVSTPSYINTFQRGEQESVFETVPHPSWESFDWGGGSGFLPLFTLDANYSEQWRYTSATDADARAVQAMYWALQWADEQGTSSANLDLDKASKMGDYLRLGMFDKYFKPMGVQSATTGAGTGYDSAHYLMSWYISWGGSADTSSPWAFRISSSHCHFGYQNPVAAYALTQVNEMKPTSQNGTRDWGTSLGRQMEFYSYLQSAEGGIAGGATNSWNGDYSSYPVDKSTFYGMAYDDNPVYHDPGSGTWFGWQAWSMERVAEYYYITNDPTAKTLMDNWTTWVESEVQLVGDNDFLIPATLEWTGEPDTWNPDNPGSNADLHVTVLNHNVDLGIAASTAKTLIYYAAATEKYATLDTGAQTLAKEILDRMWTTYRDDKGCSSPESRGDFSRIFEEEVYVPSGYTGVMGQGEIIEEGIKFLDIRTGYLTDPEYPALLEAYESGTDYTTNYHRTWAQMEIALANAEYGFFFGTDKEAAAKSIASNFSVVTYPNPASNEITVSVTAFNGVISGSEVVVSNLLGQTVGSKTISEGETSTQVDVSTYPSGIYLVTVYKGSQKIKTEKIVVN